MQFYLQFAYNMQVICCELVKEWGGGTVIMSPRDCKPPDEENDKPCELEKHAASIRKSGGTIVIDPQFYVPDADHKTLTTHGYWPEEYDSVGFWKDGSDDYADLVRKVGELNERTESGAIIVPGTLGQAVDDDWLGRQEKLIGEAVKHFTAGKELYATVALSADAVKATDQIHRVLAAAEGWKVQGIYLVCEHPENQYLVEQDAWLMNVLDLTAGFRLRGLKVIIGYANQQMLVAACAKATGIASGSHKMKRRFSPTDMMSKDDEDYTARQTTWYYCPQAYSEFKLPRLDSALLQKVLDKMRHPKELGVPYADILFTGVQPTTLGFKLKLSFKHYLGCLRAQAEAASKFTFDQTVKDYKKSIDDAENLLKELDAKRIRAEDRSFLPVIDPTHVAVSMLEEDRGAMLRRKWAKL